MEGVKNGQYYATRDWNGGPNVEVIYKGEAIDIETLKKTVEQYCQTKNLSWTQKISG